MLNLNETLRGGTMCLSKAGLTIGSTASQIAIAAPNGAGVDYCINGIMYHKADTASAAITAAEVQADLTSCLYLVCLNAAGTVSTVKGREVRTAALAAKSDVLEYPHPTTGTCPIGAIRVDNSGGTFTAGTTLLSAGTVTDTYIDLFCIPTAALTA